MAATLAQAGRAVSILEEGPPIAPGFVPHAPASIGQLYRNGGLTPVLGTPTVAFVEGCCVGGSTEVNAGFWHRTPPEVIERWRESARISDFDVASFMATLNDVERVVGIGQGPPRVAPDAASLVLARGAASLGWRCDEIPRALWAEDAESEFRTGARRSAATTWLPIALAHGATIRTHCRATNLVHNGQRVRAVECLDTKHGRPRRLTIEADHVFVCGGALQTPTLLARSGITRNIGHSLRLHLMLKAVAEFDEALEPRTAVLPVCQIKEHGPDQTLGGSVCTPGFLAITLGDARLASQQALHAWRRTALYYTLCRASAPARVRPFPFTGEAFARYTLTEDDRRNLTQGLLHLCEVLFGAGARRVYPGLRGWPAFERLAACREKLSRPLPPRDMSLSSVHAFSSCPMGEHPRAAVDSLGRLHGFQNLYVADASMLPSSPAVNPQATIMTVSLRNARGLLDGRL